MLRLGLVALLVMIALVVSLTALVLRPPAGDLLALATFLSFSGGASILLGLAAAGTGCRDGRSLCVPGLPSSPP